MDFEGAIDSNFMVKSCEKGIAGSGKPYLNIVFQDNSGTLDAKKWDVQDSDLSILIPGDVVGIQGNVLKYKGKPQLKVAKVYQLNQDLIDRSEFVQTAPYKLSEAASTNPEFLK